MCSHETSKNPIYCQFTFPLTKIFLCVFCSSSRLHLFLMTSITSGSGIVVFLKLSTVLKIPLTVPLPVELYTSSGVCNLLYVRDAATGCPRTTYRKIPPRWYFAYNVEVQAKYSTPCSTLYVPLRRGYYRARDTLNWCGARATTVHRTVWQAAFQVPAHVTVLDRI
jgi:hypothetical protein